jgi:hypothetical protein
VFAVQVRAGLGGDEELTAVGVGSTIGHGKQKWLVVFQLQVFIRKRRTINRF